MFLRRYQRKKSGKTHVYCGLVESLLRELAKIQIGDILLSTTDGRQLALRRVARPMPEQARILAALQGAMPGLELPERLSPDRLL